MTLTPQNDFSGEDPDKTIDAAASILAPIFLAYGWKWATAESPDGIPSEAEIASTITQLFDSLTGEITRSSTGRIVAARDLHGEPGERVERHIYLDLGTVYGPEVHA